jgi:hypothetical protein
MGVYKQLNVLKTVSEFVKYSELAQNWVRKLVCEHSNTIPDFQKTDFFKLWPFVCDTTHIGRCLPKYYNDFC